MESDLIHHQQSGSKKEDLVAGLSYSIVYNYLNKVVEKHEIGENIFFQGGTAFNQGVVAAFEKVLKRKVVIPPHHDVTGAIGAAILVSQENNNKTSKFKGFDLSQRNYKLSTFECNSCPNNCEIKKLTIKEEKKPLYYGSRCEKYEIDRQKRKSPYPDLFAQREELLFEQWKKAEEELPFSAEVIGIPRSMLFFDLLPFWSTFFSFLGYRTVISCPTNKSLIRKGLEIVASETCFPIKAAHGHILELLENGIKKVFFPSIINLSKMHPQVNQSYVCPYVQSLPYTIQASINFKNWDAELLRPVIYMGERREILKKNLISFGKTLGKKPKKIESAFKEAENAQNKFYEQVKQKGKEILSNLEKPALVIVSRPYNCYDKGINLSLSDKIKDLGVLAIPIDFLPLEEQKLIPEWQDMYWKFGQKILAAGEIIKNNDNLFGLYITNFSCGPDSFISHFFRKKMGEKPYLQIEIDEHSADVGIITRLEAFLDSLKNIKKLKKAYSVKKLSKKTSTDSIEGRTIYIPDMTDHTYVLAATFRAHGISARVVPKTDHESVKLGRKFTSGKECYPCVITTGDMLKKISSPGFSPEKTAFFMPSGHGPCRFGQYYRLHRMILDEMGLTQIPILSFMQDEKMYEELKDFGKDFTRLTWNGLVAVDLLEKRLREVRPYEKKSGDTQKVYKKALDDVCNTIQRKQKDLKNVLKEADIEFNKIELDSSPQKPVIGIVGEIFIRCHGFSNENIVEKIESLGGEAWLPPFTEWILYTNYTAKKRALLLGDYRMYIKNLITDKIQRKDEHRLSHIFKNSLRNYPEKSTEEIIDLACDYIHPSFEGEAILSIGKAIDFYKKGVGGIVNVMPFTCMPGTIVTAVLKRVKEKHNNIPVLFMSYDGQQQTNSQTRLEAFIYQVMEYRKSIKNENS
jgi:predicted nucleotide-binding protein (sugar kinase/HSP70/actin superfamily)